MDPPTVSESAPRVVTADVEGEIIPAPSFDQPTKSVSMSVTDLAEQVDLPVSEVVNLKKMNFITEIPGTSDFGIDALEIARGIAALGQFGIEPRHLRPFSTRQSNSRNSSRTHSDQSSLVATPRKSDTYETKPNNSQLSFRLQSMVIRASLAKNSVCRFTQGGSPGSLIANPHKFPAAPDGAA